MKYETAYSGAGDGSLLLRQVTLKKETVPVLLGVIFEGTGGGPGQNRRSLQLDAWFTNGFIRELDRSLRGGLPFGRRARLESAFVRLAQEMPPEEGGSGGAPCTGILCAGEQAFLFSDSETLYLCRLQEIFGRPSLVRMFGGEERGTAFGTLTPGTRLLLCPASWMTSPGEEAVLEPLYRPLPPDRLQRHLRELGGPAVFVTGPGPITKL
jgi:hypothetical protein